MPLSYLEFVNPNSTSTENQYYWALIHLTALNDTCLSKIIDKRFHIQPYFCERNVQLHVDLKHSLRETALMFFNGDLKLGEHVNQMRLYKLLDVVNNLHHKKPYVFSQE